jgi:catechol 2,3-dioxygenase-like lactoylglutathione lyase family enzyme
MPIATMRAVALDCPDPLALARFYAAILGGEPEAEDETGNWVDLEGHEGTSLAFQAAPGHVPPVWPSTDGSQQLHLDLTVEDLDTAEAQVLALGATLLDTGDPTRNWRVYSDPAGHPFCLCVD